VWGGQGPYKDCTATDDDDDDDDDDEIFDFGLHNMTAQVSFPKGGCRVFISLSGTQTELWKT
jgi:hypothetical protein